MISGENTVIYTPIEAYSLNAADSRVTSGGFGDDVTVTQGVVFLWVYDPDLPNGGGFTGNGWFCGLANMPLANVTQEELIRQFEEEGRTNLNDYFQAWQEVVSNQGQETDYVKDFTEMVGYNCWSTRT